MPSGGMACCNQIPKRTRIIDWLYVADTFYRGLLGDDMGVKLFSPPYHRYKSILASRVRDALLNNLFQLRDCCTLLLPCLVSESICPQHQISDFSPRWLVS